MSGPILGDLSNNRWSGGSFWVFYIFIDIVLASELKGIPGQASLARVTSLFGLHKSEDLK
jgi:hypothetical protein